MQDERAHSWRVQAVSVAAGSFENRKSLPAAWMGLRDAQLSEIAGIPDCVFVHASGVALLHAFLDGLTIVTHIIQIKYYMVSQQTQKKSDSRAKWVCHF